jgi:hypothetical protein
MPNGRHPIGLQTLFPRKSKGQKRKHDGRNCRICSHRLDNRGGLANLYVAAGAYNEAPRGTVERLYHAGLSAQYLGYGVQRQ